MVRMAEIVRSRQIEMSIFTLVLSDYADTDVRHEVATGPRRPGSGAGPEGEPSDPAGDQAATPEAGGLPHGLDGRPLRPAGPLGRHR